MAGEYEFHDDNPPPPPPVTPTQQAPHTLSTIKLHILKKGEYDIWAMKMEHYLRHTDYPIWEVIQKGNGPVQVSIDTNGQIRILPPKTVEEILARERERKARTTLLIFSDNDEFKKMHKYILKQQFESFSVSPLKMPIRNFLGLYLLLGPNTNDVSTAYGVSTSSSHNSQKEGSSSYTDELKYSSFANQSSSPQLDHEDLKQVDVFDLEEMDLKWQVTMISMRLKKFYKKTRIRLQFDAKEPVGFDKTKEPKALVTLDGDGVDWTGHAEDKQENFASMAHNNSGSNTKVTSCSKECEESYPKLKKLYDEQRNNLVFMKIDLDDKTNVLTYHKKLLAEAVKEKEELKTKLENFQSSSKGLSKLLNSQMSTRDKSGLGYGNQIHEGVLSYEKEVLESVFDSRSSDVEDNPVNDRFAKVKGMHAVPPPMTGIYMPSKSDFGIDESKFTYGPKQSKTTESDDKTSDTASCESNSSVETPDSVPKTAINEPTTVSKSKVWSDAPIIEEYESDTCKNPRETVKEQKTYSLSPKANKRDWNSLMSKKLGLGYGFTKKACFVYGSFSHLIRDCDFHEKRMAKLVKLNKQKGKETGQGETRPVWNIVQRLSHQNKFVPKAVLTKTSIFPVNAARQNPSSQAAETSTARNVNTARPIVNEIRQRNNFYKSHSRDALLHYDAEIELMNLIQLSIPNDIYNSVDACTSAKDMWKRVERLMRGTIQNKVDRETRFTNKFDQFVAEPGEALVSVYNRFAQLMNDLERNDMHFPIVIINTKFLNSLQPEWLKYVTQVRLAKRLTVDTFDDLFYYLQQFEKLVNVSREKKLEKSHDHLASRSTLGNSGNAGRNNRRAYVQEEIVEGSNAPNETGNVQRTL
ncbi:hypothetical protein Tco_0158977 [Tanacetum coccineum]